jgi:hypothetical protein
MACAHMHACVAVGVAVRGFMQLAGLWLRHALGAYSACCTPSQHGARTLRPLHVGLWSGHRQMLGAICRGATDLAPSPLLNMHVCKGARVPVHRFAPRRTGVC